MSASGLQSERITLQAVCLGWLGRGLLLRGPPGTGKSDLALRLLEAGADLVADDLVALERRDERLIARPVAYPGLVEARGQGLFRLASLPNRALDLLVDCRARTATRLPAPRRETILGVALPVLALACRDASAPARLRLALLAEPFGGALEGSR
ncbi:MAG: hypothetical protein NZ555_15645 [Geminicoccaceae bacterium]|nr:hypothetical protein [Geminicoccaceae bacterium]MDW8370937.1 hypothetical protein [Geminicoccaceae bacterium]